MAVAKENKLVRGQDLYYVGQRIKENFAAKEDGKGLSTNDYTTDEKTKLAGIESGAQKNVKPDWNAASGDAQILHKPSIPTKTSDLTNDSGFVTSGDIPEGVQPATANPLMDGAAAIGSSAKYAKEDHVHPSDSSKADKATTLSGYGITNAYTKAEVDTAISNKQDTISDLATIRSGASAGATAVQPAALNAKQDTIADLSAIRSGAALGSTSVQPADIEDMVEAEPIGSIIPPVNPSEFATKEEVSQLGQKVGDFEVGTGEGQYPPLFEQINGGDTESAKTDVTGWNEEKYFNMTAAADPATTYYKNDTQYADAAAGRLPCKCLRISVSANDVYYIKGKAANVNHYGLYVLTDAAHNIISKGLANTDYSTDPLRLVVEQDGFLYINLPQYLDSYGVQKSQIVHAQGIKEHVDEEIEKLEKNRVINLDDFVHNLETGEYFLGTDIINSNTWRLHAKFKIGGYVEGVTGRSSIARFSNYNVSICGEPNGLMDYQSETSWMKGVFPIPKRNVFFSVGKGTSYPAISDYNRLSLPRHNEVIGKDLFTIRYTGGDLDSHSNLMMLSFVNGVLTISESGSTLYTYTIPSSVTSVADLVSALNADSTFTQNYECELITLDDVPVGDIADITQVCLVSEYWSADSFGATRKDAFPCYFQSKVDERVHDVEIVCLNGRCYFSIDGYQPRETYTDNLGTFTGITLGSNDVVPINIISAEVNVGNIGDAEISQVGSKSRIVSSHNPSVILFECHDIITEGGVDEQLNPDLLAATTSRLDKLFGDLTSKGYVCISPKVLEKLPSIDGLPKRCFSFVIDGERQELFNDIRIQHVFSKHDVQPALAVTFRNPNVFFDNISSFADKVMVQGWETLYHGLNHIKVASMSQEQLYDLSTQIQIVVDADGNPTGIIYDGTGSGNSDDTRRFGVQCQAADLSHSYLACWVYAGGAANPNTIKAFKRFGIRCGIMTPIYGEQSTRFSNAFYLSRNNVQNGNTSTYDYANIYNLMF